jgi:hypothetical protein
MFDRVPAGGATAGTRLLSRSTITHAISRRHAQHLHHELDLEFTSSLWNYKAAYCCVVNFLLHLCQYGYYILHQARALQPYASTDRRLRSAREYVEAFWFRLIELDE